MRRAAGFVLAIAFAQVSVAAHALDEYVQAARLSLSQSEVSLTIDLTPGVQVATPIVAMIDRDQDGVVTPAEAVAYGNRVLADTAVTLDGEPVAMTLTRIEVPPVGEMREGTGTIHLNASGAHDVRLSDRAQLSFRNDHAPVVSVYAANALLPNDASFSVLRQDRDVIQRSIVVLYGIQPAFAWQMGWLTFAVVGSAGLIIVRRRRAIARPAVPVRPDQKGNAA